MSKFQRFIYLLSATTLLVAPSSYAWWVPGFSLGSSFSSIQTTDPAGANYRFSSKARYDFKPDLTWIDRLSYSEFSMQAKAQYFRIAPPNDDTKTTGTPLVCFGGDLRYSFTLVSRWVASLNADFNEFPVLDIHTPINASISKAAALTTPVDLTYRLMALETQALRIGGGGFLFVPYSPKRVTGGSGYQFHVNYEMRGQTKIELIFYLDGKSFTVDSNQLASSEFGLNIRFSFWGPQGLSPPPDERDN